jgi:NitT/TauT family transport system substrate-binding protein
MRLRRFLAMMLTWLLVSASAFPTFGAAAKPVNVRVGLPGRLSFNWPLYVAAERGIFRQEELNVELIVLRSATVQTQAILAGDLQVNLNAVDSVARAVVAGAPLRFVGSAQEKPAFRMIATKEPKDGMTSVAKCWPLGFPVDSLTVFCWPCWRPTG